MPAAESPRMTCRPGGSWSVGIAGSARIEFQLAIVDGLGHARQDAALFFRVEAADRRAELVLLLPGPTAGLQAKIHQRLGFGDGLELGGIPFLFLGQWRRLWRRT